MRPPSEFPHNSCRAAKVPLPWGEDAARSKAGEGFRREPAGEGGAKRRVRVKILRCKPMFGALASELIVKRK